MAERETKQRHPLVRVADRPRETSFSHPLNPASEMHGISLSEIAGLERVGFHLVRIPPGRESNIYHSHVTQEEFFYVLSGRGLAEIDGVEHEVGPGDFMGFATPSVPHHLRNPFDEDFVYLVGGERKEIELAEFPRLGKHVVRIGRTAYTIDDDKLEPFWKEDD